MQKKIKKLVLSRETLAELTKAEAREVAGCGTATGRDCIFCTLSATDCC